MNYGKDYNELVSELTKILTPSGDRSDKFIQAIAIAIAAEINTLNCDQMTHSDILDKLPNEYLQELQHVKRASFKQSTFIRIPNWLSELPIEEIDLSYSTIDPQSLPDVPMPRVTVLNLSGCSGKLPDNFREIFPNLAVIKSDDCLGLENLPKNIINKDIISHLRMKND